MRGEGVCVLRVDFLKNDLCFIDDHNNISLVQTTERRFKLVGIKIFVCRGFQFFDEHACDGFLLIVHAFWCF